MHVRPVDAGGRDLDQDLAGRPGVGVGRCSGTSTSGPPGVRIAIAVMRAGSVVMASLSGVASLLVARCPSVTTAP